MKKKKQNIRKKNYKMQIEQLKQLLSPNSIL